jgi:hypothetical protein
MLTRTEPRFSESKSQVRCLISLDLTKKQAALRQSLACIFAALDDTTPPPPNTRPQQTADRTGLSDALGRAEPYNARKLMLVSEWTSRVTVSAPSRSGQRPGVAAAGSAAVTRYPSA